MAEILFDLKSNAGDLADQFAALSARVDALDSSFKGAAAEAGKLDKNTKDAAKDTKDLAAQTPKVSGLGKELGSAAKSTEVFGSALTSATGSFSAFSPFVAVVKSLGASLKGAAQGILGFAKGTQGASAAFRGLGVAIAASGIGLLVVILGSIVSFFTQTNEGSKQFRAILTGLGEFFGVFRDRVSAFGERLISAFKDPVQLIKDIGQLIVDNIINRFLAFGKIVDAIRNGSLRELGDALLQLSTGITDFSRKAESAFNSIGDAIGEAADAFERARQNQLALLKVTGDLRREIEVLNSEERIRSTQLLRLSRNRTLDAEKRLAFLRDAARIEQAAFDRTLANKQEELRLLQIANSFTDTAEADLQKLADLEIEINNLKASRINLLETIQNREDAILAEIEADRLKAEQARLDALAKIAQAELALRQKTEQVRQEIILAGIENEFDRRQKALEFQLDAELAAVEESIANEQLKDEARIAILERFAQEAAEIERARLKSLTKDEETALERSIIFYEKRRNELLKDLEQGLIDNETFQRRLLEAEIAALEIRLAEAEAGSLEFLQIENELIDKRLALQDKLNEEIKKRQQSQKQAALELAESTLAVGQALAQQQVAEATRVADAQRQVIDAIRERQRAGEKVSADEVRANEERLQKLQEQQERAVRRQQELAQVELLTKTIVAVANALAAGDPFTAGLRVAAVLATLAAGLAAARSTAAAALPAFKEGVVDFQGKGTGTSDSNIVRISRGESVITADATRRYRHLLKAMNEGLPLPMNVLPPAPGAQHLALQGELVKHYAKVEGKLDKLITVVAGKPGGFSVIIGDRDVAQANRRYVNRFARMEKRTTK